MYLFVDQQTEFALPNDYRAPAPPSPIPTLQASMTIGSSPLQHLKEQPLFFHPPVFRPNSLHVGRKEQLDELHRLLRDPVRRKDGTSAVIVKARTGGGKSHTVREYVFEHRHDYAGGVFWLVAHSKNDLKIELRRLWHLLSGHHYYDALSEADDGLSRSILDWFNGRQDWLIILDGIMNDEGIERFVPDAANTSLIFTSTSSSFSGSPQYDNPTMLELPALSTTDAQHMLLLEMEHKKPWSQQDLAQAKQLVHALEKLPLMIHIMAQQLKQTREPLSAYLKRSDNKPNIPRSIQQFDLVLKRLDERGAIAAMNVLNVLAFYDQYIPVQMLALGESVHHPCLCNCQAKVGFHLPGHVY